LTQLGLKIFIAGEFEAPEDMRDPTACLLAVIGKVESEHMDNNIDISISLANGE
jgi:hypothetical protein